MLNPSSPIVTDWRLMEPTKGSTVLRFTGFSLTKDISTVFESETFIVGDYKWLISFYPNGNSKSKKGFVSIYIYLVSDNCLVQASSSYALVDPSGAKSSIEIYSPSINVFNTTKKKESSRTAWGYLSFMERKKLEEHPYFQDDCFAIECTIHILKEFRIDVDSRTPGAAAMVPPLDLQKQLVSLLESGLGADISFEVSGKTFCAHSCILAARSPVFRAQLLGPLKESTGSSIVIHDMDARVFKAMLRFIYSDSDSESCPEIEDSVPLAQHLLEAADHYELERLRLICEHRIIKGIDVATVATTLVLAEQHECMQLKASCLMFLASPSVLKAVVLTEGFQHLSISCPSIAKDLSTKASSSCK